MKEAGLLFLSMVLFLGFTSCIGMESSTNYQAQGTYKGSVPFIFIERNVEFAIYPNGEFDFAYVGPNYQNNPYNGPRRAFSYNGGYNYDMYIQFDRYGAVIQVESVPIYYDYYGRISQVGNIILKYSGDYVIQIGSMHIIYERGNIYLASSGYVNSYNQHLRPQPWHSYYARPYYPIVYTVPYRQNYKPIRYEYDEHRRRYNNRGRSNYDNGRRTFVDPVTQAPRREATTDNRRENIQNPTDNNRGRNNTPSRRENTSEPTKGRRDSATPTEEPRRGESNQKGNRRDATPPPSNTNSRGGTSSTKQQEANRRETATPSNSNAKRGASSSANDSTNRRESNESGNRRGPSSSDQTNRRR